MLKEMLGIRRPIFQATHSALHSAAQCELRVYPTQTIAKALAACILVRLRRINRNKAALAVTNAR